LSRLIRDKQTFKVIEAANKQINEKKATINSDKGSVCSQKDEMFIESFIRDAHKAVTVLDDLCELDTLENRPEDLQRLIFCVHGIKCPLAIIGEHGLSKIACGLETACREKDFETINKDFAVFGESIKSLLEELKVNQDKMCDCSDEDIDDLCLKFSAINEMCADYIRKDVLDTIFGMKNCSKETMSVLEKIKICVMQSDFDKAADIAKAYIEELRLKNKTLLPNRQVDGLDIEKGLERYGGDEKSYLKILSSYVASISPMLNTIEVINENMLAGYKITVHGIKGASRGIFAIETADSAEKLENAATLGNFNYVEEHNQTFLDNTKKLVLNIEELLSVIESENPKPKKDKPDKEALLKLLDACKSCLMEDVDNVMSEIDSYQYDSDDGLVSWLRGNVDMMNFTEIVEKLSNLDLTGGNYS
jgi:HPt (histidine-containing phosphotransfer) domain-containing protein